MKRKILNVVCVLLILLLVLSLIPVSYLVRKTGADRKTVTGFYAEEPNTLDVVYIGGSACYVFFQPLRAWSEYGFTSYNFAHMSITPEAVKYYIKEVRKTQDPKLFVIDLRPFQYGDLIQPNTEDTPYYRHEASIRNGTDNMPYSKNRIDLIDASVPDASERLPYYIDLIKYHSRWWTIPYNFISSLRSGDWSFFDYADNARKNELKGYYFADAMNAVTHIDYSHITERADLSEPIRAIFIDLLDFCRDESVNALFVVHAYNQEEGHQQEFNTMEEILASYGFPYLNCCDHWEEIGLDETTDFVDAFHVNVFGAEKYTNFLAGYICGHYALPDHRGDAAFQEWDALSAAFVDRVAEDKAMLLAGQQSQESDIWN